VSHSRDTYVCIFIVDPTIRVSTFERSTIILLHRYARQRTLHSFPTRRSSDLIRPSAYSSPSSLRGSVVQLPWSAASSSVLVRPRSEEHTSELQSRFDLVCRLLLEKKKKDYNR